MDERESQDWKPLQSLREVNPMMATMTPPPSFDDSPSVANRRRARPFSLLSYNPVIPQLSHSPSSHPSESHSRQASFTSATRPLPLPSTANPSKRPSRWTVIVKPPPLLPHSPPPPHVSGFAQGYGPSGRYSTGLLLPVQPTLTLQLTTIAREFSLPSTGGLSLHLSISPSDQPIIPGPRVTDESWSILFGWTFEDIPPPYAGLQPSIGLPVAGRLEFDIDLKKARWFDAWAASGQATNRLSSQLQYSLKIASANSTPAANRAPDSSSGPSTLPQVTRAPSFDLPRRSSSQSSITFDTSYNTSKQRPITISEHREDDMSSPAPNKPTGISQRSLSTSSSTADSGETLRQQLERLVQSEDCALAEENNWHIQQETMLLQAAIEREQIELADRLEEERRIDEETRSKKNVTFQDNQQIQENPINSSDVESSSSQRPPSPSASNSQITNAIAQSASAESCTATDARTENNNQTESTRLSDPAHSSYQIALQENPSSPIDQFTPHMSHSSETQVNIESIECAPEVVSYRENTIATHSTVETTIIEEKPKIEEYPLDSTTTINLQGDTSSMLKSVQTTQFIVTADSTMREQVAIKSPEHIPLHSTHEQVVTSRPLMDSTNSNQDTPSQVNSNPTSKELVNVTHRPEPISQHKVYESGSPSFSTTLGRSVNRFSGEQELMKRRIQTEQGSEETQKLIDEMDQLVNEKATAKAASILSNPKKIVVHDNISPVKATPKAPPPPPTRSKVVQLARAFSPSDERSPNLTQRSPRSDAPSREHSPAITAQPLPPSPSELELDFRHLGHSSNLTSRRSLAISSVPHSPSTLAPEPDFRPLSPVIQGASSHSPAIPFAPPLSSSTSPSVQPILAAGSNSSLSLLPSQSTSYSNVMAADPLAPLLYCYEDTSSLSDQLAKYLVNAQDQALERHGKFVIAISGGSLFHLLASGLLQNPGVKWDTWKVFFADEKIVPLDHPDSNFANSMEILFEKTPINRSQVISILGLPPDVMDLDEMGPLVSSIYMAQVLEELDPSLDAGELPRFDLILLGVGEDGHTCSLFPSHRLLNDATIIGWCNDSPEPPTYRITMTLPTLNAAYDLAIVCIGSSKDEIVRSILDDEPSHERPASLVKLPHKPVVWFVDKAAAAKSRYPRSVRESNVSDQVQWIAKDLATDHEFDKSRALNGLKLELTSPSPIAQVTSTGLIDTHATSDAVCNQEVNNVSSFSGILKDMDLFGNEFEYPYNLQIYRAVYPHVDQQLYRPPVPHIPYNPFHSQEFLSGQSVSKIDNQRAISAQIDTEKAELEKESDSQHMKVIGSDCTSTSVLMTGLDYPFNLSVYPSVYSHLADSLSSPAALNTSISPRVPDVGPLSPMVSLTRTDELDVINSSNQRGLIVTQQTPLKLVHLDDISSQDSIGYPYSLIVYPAVYPYITDTLYPEIGPRCSVPIAKLQETEIVQQSNPPDLELDLDADQFELTESPVSVLPATSTEAFRSPIQSSKVTSASKGFFPALLYTEKKIDNSLVGSVAVSSLATRAAPSTLDESDPNSDIQSAPQLPLSPVQILASQLADSFYRDNPDQPSEMFRVVPSSVPFMHQFTVENQATRASPNPPAAALEAQTFSLGEGFFTCVAPQDLKSEMVDLPIDEKPSTEALSKDPQENDRQDCTDRHSEGSFSHFSKVDSINTHATLHQSTDDDWPPTPHSSDGVISPESTNGFGMSTPLVLQVDRSSSNQSQLILPKSPPFHVDQPLDSLIESDKEVSVSSVSRVGILSPSVTQFLDESVVAVADGSDSFSNASDLPAQSTPRTSIAQSSTTLTAKSFVESEQPRTGLETDITDGSNTKDTSELRVETTPRASTHSHFESMASTSGADDVMQSKSGLDPLNVQLGVPLNEHISPNNLGIDLGLPAIEKQRDYSRNEGEVNQQLSDLEATCTFGEGTLIPSSDRLECQITPLDLIAETAWTNTADLSSPPRLPSPSLIDRLILTPDTARNIEKQFPSYEAHLTCEDEKAFAPLATIEVAWDCPQVPLCAVGFPSPTRFPSILLSPHQTEHSIGSHKKLSSLDDSHSDDQLTQSLALNDETTKTMIVRSDPGPSSPFFLDQPPGASTPYDDFENDVNNISPSSSSIHAISINWDVPNPSQSRASVERSLNTSHDSRVDYPKLPPLNLAMDLSDPLSAASTARLDGYDTPKSHAEEAPEQTPSEQLLFEDQSNGFNFDQVPGRSGPRFSGDSSDELVTELTTNISESLPSITKRAPTPVTDDVGIAVGQDSIEEGTPSPPPILLPFEDLAELSEALAQFIFEAQEVALQRHGKFQLALGGSVLPQILGAGLVGDDRMRWNKWELFLVEEAIAPLESPQSVLSAITESIIQHVPIPRAQVHSIAELTKADLIETTSIPEGLDSLADSLADEYENKLLELFPEASHETAQPPEFDLILISVGEEGQVGSLYPSHPMLGESNWFVAWLGDAWEPPSHRITLTLPVLNAARQFAFLAIGHELAEIVADGLDRSIQSEISMSEDRVNPTALVKSSNLKPVVWFTDFAAAALTDYPQSTFWDEP